MGFGAAHIGLLIAGLLLAFLGLPIYKSAIRFIGFVVGAGYGIYLFSLFAKSVAWDPIFVIVTACFFVIVMGILGTFVAQAANMVLFFLTGGLVGVMMAKIVAGATAGEIIDQSSVLGLMTPRVTDLIWFIGGGIVFVISIEVLIMLALASLGTGLIWFALRPLEVMRPDWLIPVVLGVLGLGVQEASRRRRRGPPKLPRLKYKPRPVVWKTPLRRD